MAQSRYSESDLTGSGEPDPSDLDYAILHLVEQIGSLPGRSNNPRGWFELETDGPVVTLRDFVVIPQHAEGHPLEIAWGSVVAFPASGHRVRYDTTTSPHYSAH